MKMKYIAFVVFFILGAALGWLGIRRVLEARHRVYQERAAELVKLPNSPLYTSLAHRQIASIRQSKVSHYACAYGTADLLGIRVDSVVTQADSLVSKVIAECRGIGWLKFIEDPGSLAQGCWMGHHTREGPIYDVLRLRPDFVFCQELYFSSLASWPEPPPIFQREVPEPEPRVIPRRTSYPIAQNAIPPDSDGVWRRFFYI